MAFGSAIDPAQVRAFPRSSRRATIIAECVVDRVQPGAAGRRKCKTVARGRIDKNKKAA